jgi:hypothetical protein
VDAGSTISADSQGYVAGAGPGTPVSGYSGSYGAGRSRVWFLSRLWRGEWSGWRGDTPPN